MPLIPRRRRPRSDAMTVVEHLGELRRRLVISLAAVAVASLVGFAFFDPIFDLFKEPYCRALRTLPEAGRPPDVVTDGGCVLRFTGVTDPLVMRVKIGLFTGFAIALPVVLYQLWRFITPGLTQRERRLALPFVLSSVALFALGAWFALFTLPRALSFLLGLAGDIAAPLITIDRYVSFLLFLILAFGLAFEFPIVLIFLAAARVITTRQMRRWRRGAYVASIAAAAVITPSQDPYTLLAMWLPLVVFYELSIVVARLMKR